MDAGGQRIQRTFHTLFHAETVEVVPANMIDSLTAGATTVVPFIVRNVGPSASFRITAVDGSHVNTRVEPRSLTLATGESATVTVPVTVADEASAGSGVQVTVTAVSTGGPSTTNGASIHLSVSAKTPQ